MDLLPYLARQFMIPVTMLAGPSNYAGRPFDADERHGFYSYRGNSGWAGKSLKGDECRRRRAEHKRQRQARKANRA
jgi:hypothetical protein